MTAIDEKQEATAKWLASHCCGAKAGRDALWNLAGAVGSGKTSVLRRVADLVRAEGLVPLLITAPASEVDSAAIALLETASQLKTASLLNGEMAAISDPRRSWSKKMSDITSALRKHHRKVVILCDEPTRWYHRQESLLDDTPDFCARSFAEWISREASCRRIISGRIPGDVPAHAATSAPRLEDGREFLVDNQQWGAATNLAGSLHESIWQAAPKRSLWEMKLCVALLRLKTVDEVASQVLSEISADSLLAEFLDLLERDESCRQMSTALTRLAIARTVVDRAVFDRLTEGLQPLDRDIVDECLCDWDRDRVALHPLVRHEVITRARDPRRWDTNSVWRLSRDERAGVHRHLKEQYPIGNYVLRNDIESLHHELLGGIGAFSESDGRLRFVEQLHEIGRTLSYLHHEHRRAAELFRIALKFDARNAYSHHYLAFNLDWLAEEPDEVESHYQQATQLQPTHPWWWSRWISYLTTRGRFRDARSTWRDAMDSLSVSEDGSPSWLYLSLHRWVARWLLHWGELDFAEDVLRSIPDEVIEEDSSIQVLSNLLAALRQAQRGVSVFPLTVPANEWWSPNPHTTLPLIWQDQPLRSWLPARIDVVDDLEGLAYLTAGKHPVTVDAQPEFTETSLTRDEVNADAHGFCWEDLAEGRFVEIAYYGTDNIRRIGLHREIEWRDRQLIPLVPPPDRWYRRAVDAAWVPTGEQV